MHRDLFTTVRMLWREGIEVDLRVVRGQMVISLGDHTAVFSDAESRVAASWLARCAVMHYPESDFAKVWLLLAKAAAAGIRME